MGNTKLKVRTILAISLAFSALSISAYAEWVEGKISEIYIVADGSGQDKIAVSGSFVPCSNSAFMIIETDKFMKETYSMLLAAKMADKPIKYLHVYCHESGYSRGNGYKLL